jgi:hypothetical protein
VRLALARPGRSATAIAVLAVSAAFALLILSIATLRSRLQSEPQASAARTRSPSPRRLRSCRACAGCREWSPQLPRYDTFASDSFDLGESFELVAFGADHAGCEAPPLAEGRRLRGRHEAEVGLDSRRRSTSAPHSPSIAAAAIVGRQAFPSAGHARSRR